MPEPRPLRLREAGAADAEPIARLHAESWRRHYRGAYSDEFLDGHVFADRLVVWRGRLQTTSPHAYTLVAERGDNLAGFGHLELDDDATWGSLLDNLHVDYREQRAGIGSRLLREIANGVIERAETNGLYLWVLEQNIAARAFYESRGGTCVERAVAEPPGGNPSRLRGTPMKLRFVWPEPAALLQERRPNRRARA